MTNKLFYFKAEGKEYLIRVPGEGTEYLLDILPQCADPAAKNAEETLDERSEQDGAVLLSTTTRFQDAGGYYYTTLYYADPETGELLAMSVTDYIEDGAGGATEYYTSGSAESFAANAGALLGEELVGRVRTASAEGLAQ